MSDTPNPLANPDGARRYEELMADIKATAEQALSIAISQSVVGSSAVLDIEHGGTGASTKIFVDTLTNQFNIDGIKIFHSSCGFQQESDIVDSGDLAGMIRLISCTPQGQDIGPQMRFCGRNTDDNLSVFSFGTIAGRKSNSTSGDLSGYLQFATTNKDGEIVERMRVDEEGNFGVGASIPVKSQGNRLWVSGGDVFLDNDFPGVSGADISGAGGPHAYKLKVDSTLGRMQGIASDISSGVEDIFLSINTSFNPDLTNVSDNPSLGTAAIQLRSSSSHGEIGFWIGDSPLSKVGVIDNFGLSIVRNIDAGVNISAGGYVSAGGFVVAGGINNELNQSGNTTYEGVVTGDNLLTGDQTNPNNNVSARVGAIYQSDAPLSEEEIIWVKVAGPYTNTNWKPMPFASDYTKGQQYNPPLPPGTPMVRYGLNGIPSLKNLEDGPDGTPAPPIVLTIPGSGSAIWTFRGYVSILTKTTTDLDMRVTLVVADGAVYTGGYAYTVIRGYAGVAHAFSNPCSLSQQIVSLGQIGTVHAGQFILGTTLEGFATVDGNLFISGPVGSTVTMNLQWGVIQYDKNNTSGDPDILSYGTVGPSTQAIQCGGAYLTAWRIG